MGCHVWFARPVIDSEFQLMKEYAVIEAKQYADEGMFSETFANNIAKSVETGERCVYGFRWFDYSFGMSNPKLPIDFSNNIIIRDGDKLYITVDGFHDICRESIGIYTYPHKIIHNKKELRGYIGKRYFNITEEEHELLDQFWRKYPGGIIQWG